MNPPKKQRAAGSVRSGVMNPTTRGGSFRLARFGIVASLSAVLFTMASAQAQQSVTLTANPTRLTVPVNAGTSVSSSVTVTIADGTDPVNLAITGLPAGAGATLDVVTFTNSGTAVLTLNATNVAAGEYNVTVEASGAASFSLPLPLVVGTFWSGAGGAGLLWNNPANWVGGVAPGVNDLAVFSDLGALADDSGTSVVVSASTEISSLRFNQGATRNHNVQIDGGATLLVSGPGGFYQLRDELPAPNRSYINIFGAGSLVVSNAAANFALLNDNQQESHLYMDNLDNFVADVSRIGIGDYTLYPNYDVDGNNTHPRRFVPKVRLAKTNYIHATFTDTNNWMDPAFREYSLRIGNNESSGTSARLALWLGLENTLNLDSFCFMGSGAQAASGSDIMRFGTTGTAIFRGTNGGRMSMFAISDGAAPRSSGSGVKAIVDLSGGTVDALVDRLYISRERTNSTGASIEGTLTLAAGIFDVNTAIVGFQGQGNNLGTGQAYCRGTVNVRTSAVFRVNTVLELGHTTADAGHSTLAESGYGQLNITDGGTVEANTITVGGVTKVSVNNNITLNNGGTLIVSNTVGDASARVNVLTLNDSTLVLHVNGANTDPYIFATTLTTGGSGNVIKLASVTGVNTYPSTIALISYTGSAAPNFSLDLPAGLYGYVVNNSANNTVDAVITTTPPASLVWNGSPNGNWDHVSANWQGGLTFTDGDQATFDDTAAGTTAITVVGTVTPGPGGVVISNVSKAYSFSGGDISGTAVMTKRGAQSLVLDANSQVPLTIEEGTVAGAGTIGFTTVAAGASLNFSGVLNGVSSSGNSVNAGTLNIGLTVLDGVFENTGTINGSIALTGGVTTNSSTINATGTSTVGAGATFVNNGQFNNTTARLSVGGVLTGSGTVSDLTGDANGNNGRLEINAGAVFTPGGSNAIGTFKVEGRFDLNAGVPDGTMIIDVDLNHPQKNDIVFVDKWSNLRGALQMNNIGSVPFAAGQSFVICSNNFSLPNTPETAFDLANKITPAAPGVGLQWDLSQLRTNGVIAIVSAPSTPPALTATFTGGTNLTLNWPSTHLGYQLQAQTNSLDVGLTANWYPLPGSESATNWSVTIDSTAPAVFYRLSNQ